MTTSHTSKLFALLSTSLFALTACGGGGELPMAEMELQGYNVRYGRVMEEVHRSADYKHADNLFEGDCWIALEERAAFSAGPPASRFWADFPIGYAICGPIEQADNEPDEWIVQPLALDSYRTDDGEYDYELDTSSSDGLWSPHEPLALGEEYAIYGNATYPNKDAK